MMAKLEDLGKVITADILVVGGGTAGIPAALKAREQSLDVLIVDKGFVGYAGQGTRAGHGLYHMAPGDDLDAFMKEQIEHNINGFWLNDQEMLYELTKDAYTYLAEMEKLGLVLAHEEDGSLHYHKEYPGAIKSSVNIDVDFPMALMKRALKEGVRIMNRIYISDLLKDGERVVGAVGFSMDTLEFFIFRANAVLVAGNCFNYCPGGMFMTGADPTVMCYEAGAQMRNAEQSTYIDLCIRNTREYIYWMQNHLYNKHGENISEKYAPGEKEEITIPLIAGMQKEIELGNYPLYADFTKLFSPDGTPVTQGFNMGYLMTKKVEWEEWVKEHHVAMTPKPEVSVDLKHVTCSVRVDPKIQTTVPGLYAPGAISLYGCAYGGWVHGDGLGYGFRTGLRAGKNAAEYAKTVAPGKIDAAKVEQLKERIYAPLKRKEGILPYELLRDFGVLICQSKYNIYKTEDTMKECLAKLDEMKQNLDNIYVPQGDGHHLAKFNEARANFKVMEIIFAACMARKESRGPHTRADYPKRDDKNWLKWGHCQRGKRQQACCNSGAHSLRAL